MDAEIIEIAKKYHTIWDPRTVFDLSEDEKKELSQFNLFVKLGLSGDKFLNGMARVKASGELLSSLPHQTLTRFIAEYIDETQKGPEFSDVTCKKACSACCSQEILIHSFEAKTIVEYIAQHPDAVDRDQLAKHDNWSRRSSGDGNYGWGISKDFNEFRCPMLSKEGLCRIYEVRPMVCRNYVVRSHPRSCDVSNNEKPEFMVHFDISRLMLILTNFDMPLPLAHGIGIVEENRDPAEYFKGRSKKC